MAMDSRKLKDDFSPVRLFLMARRFRGRIKQFESTDNERRKANRKRETWGYACQIAVNKMRYRHKKPVEDPYIVDLWQAYCAMMRLKLRRKTDVSEAWASREQSILIKLNERKFEQSLREKHGMTWETVVGVQCTKAKSKFFTNRRKINPNKRYSNRIYPRKRNEPEPWGLFIKAMTKKWQDWERHAGSKVF